jgi:AcrR family transcriptional regulator
MESRFDADDDPGDDTGEGDERSSRAERKAQSRRRILEAARDVFFRDGFMAANLDEVAEKAGVAKGTLYRYFESKADLYVAVLADNGNAFTERMREEARAGVGSAMDQLRRISRFYYDYWIRHPEYFQIFWAIDNQPVIGELPEAVVAEVTRLWEQSLEVLSDMLQRGIEAGELRECDTWEVANILWTTANALIQADATKPRRQLRRLPLEAVFRDAIDLIFDGLSVRRSGP